METDSGETKFIEHQLTKLLCEYAAEETAKSTTYGLPSSLYLFKPDMYTLSYLVTYMVL